MEAVVNATMKNSLNYVQNKMNSKSDAVENIDKKDDKIPSNILDEMNMFNLSRDGGIENEKSNTIIKDLSINEIKAYNNSLYMKNELKQKSLLNTLGPYFDLGGYPTPKYSKEDDEIIDGKMFAAGKNQGVSTSDSLAEFFSYINESLIVGKTDYLDVLKDIFSKYMEFVNKLRNILSKLGDYTKAGGKDGYINIDLTKLINELLELKADQSNYNIFNEEIIFSPDADRHYHREINFKDIFYEGESSVVQSMEVLKDLLNGINGIDVSFDQRKESDSSLVFDFHADINLDDLNKLIESLQNKPNGPHDILQTEFDLLKKSFDALEKKLSTNLDELSKKTSAANSNYDNFVKIVSGSINTLLEMAKGFLRF